MIAKSTTATMTLNFRSRDAAIGRDDERQGKREKNGLSVVIKIIYKKEVHQVSDDENAVDHNNKVHINTQ